MPATIYVDAAAAPGGDGSAGTPFDTIQGAITAATAGDTIMVAAGTYDEDLVIDVEGLTLQSADLHGAAINTAGLFSPGLDFGGITILADNVTLDGFSISQSVPQAIIHTHDADNVSIVNNAISGVGAANPRGIDVGFGAGNSDGVVIEGNTFSNLYTGVYLNQASNLTINQNIFDDQNDDGAIVVDGTWPIGAVAVTDNTMAGDGTLIFFFGEEGDFTVSGNTLPDGGSLSNFVHNQTQGTFHATIQEAVDAADPSDTIEVPDGTYDNVTIDKPITLIAANEGGAVINGPGVNQQAGIRIEAGVDDVTIQGFEVNASSGDLAAIYAVGNNTNLSLSGNSVDGGAFGHAFLSGVAGGVGLTDATITDNSFMGTAVSAVFYINGPASIGGSVASGNTISDNMISGNPGGGLLMEVESSDGAITGNTFAGTASYAQLEVFGTGNDIGSNSFGADGNPIVDGTASYDASDLLAGNTFPNPTVIIDGGGSVFATLQAAVNAAGANDTIVMSEGEFDGAVDLTGTTGLTIQGAQAGVSAGVGGARDIDSTAGETVFTGTFNFGGGAPSVDGLAIDGLRIEGLGFSTVRMEGLLRIENTIIESTKATNQWAITTVGFSGADDHQIEFVNNTLVGPRGVQIENGLVSSALFEGNVFNTSTSVGVNVTGSAPEGVVTVTGNEFYGVRGFQTVQNGQTVTDNVFETTQNGVTLWESENNTVTGNSFEGSGIGMLLVNGTGPRAGIGFEGNTVEDNTFTGLGTGAFFNNTATDARLGINTIDGVELVPGVLVLAGNGAVKAPFLGTPGNDTIVGTEDDDTFIASAGNDVIDGLGGDDTYDASHTTDQVVVNLGANPFNFLVPGTGFATGSEIGVDGLTNIQNVRGGAGDDILAGSSEDNTFFASAGNDVIDGIGGTNTYDASHTTGGVDIDLVAGTASGGEIGSDTLANIQVVIGGSGDDSFTVGAVDTQVEGGDGTDTVIFAGSFGDYDLGDLASDGTITDTGSGAVYTLSGVEQLSFDGGAVTAFLLQDGDSVQAAIDAASDGDILILAPGTYTGDLTIDKPITIIGPNVDLAGDDAGRGAEAVIVGRLNVTADGDGAVLDGLRMEGTTSGWSGVNLQVQAGADDVSIVNSVVVAFSAAGGFADSGYVSLNGGDVTFSDNLLFADSSFVDPATDSRSANAVKVQVTGTATITGNTISDAAGGGVGVVPTGATAVITGNTISNVGEGIFGYGDNFGDLTIADNTISDFVKNGIYIPGVSDATTGQARIFGNTVTGDNALTIDVDTPVADETGTPAARTFQTIGEVLDANDFSGSGFLVRAGGEFSLFEDATAAQTAAVAGPGVLRDLGTGQFLVFAGMSLEDASIASAFGQIVVSGIPQLDLSFTTQAVVANIAAGTATGDDLGEVSFTGVTSIIGGAGNDLLTGDGANNVLNGGGGDDTIVGSGGSDTLDGGTGTNTLLYSNAMGAVFANLAAGTAFGAGVGGIDTISNFSNLGGGAGNDVLFGTAGDNVFYASAGNDMIDGVDGRNTYNAAAAVGGMSIDLGAGTASGGGFGTDFLNNISVVMTGAGDDTVMAGGVDAEIFSGGGNNLFQGLGGRDTLHGGDGNDTLEGGGGQDVLFAGSGDNFLDGGGGQDTLYGGTGNDTLDGGNGDDVLYAGTGNTLIFGSAGDDLIYGGTGNDTLIGGADRDTIFGGDGDNEIYGGGGRDELHGGLGNDYIDGGDGADVLYGHAGNNTLDGGRGDDTIYGGSGDDLIFGSAGDDVIYANAGNNELRGGGGDDTIYGGSGNDELRGGGGDDVLYGGGGTNLLIGGSGADTFVFQGGGAQDTVADFSLLDGDVLALDQSLWGGGLTEQEVLDTYATVVGNTIELDFGGDGKIVLDSFSDIVGLVDNIDLL